MMSGQLEARSKDLVRQPFACSSSNDLQSLGVYKTFWIEAMSVVDSWSLSYARLENLPDQLLLVCCPLLKNSKLILVQETKKFNAFNRNVTCMLANV